MKILVSWLREFVDVPGTPEEIAATMSVRGFAVEGIEPAGGNDAVLDFEITANRPDCMSVMGMAREVATAYDLQVRRPVARSPQRADPESTEAQQGAALHLLSLKPVERADVDVVLEAAELCPRYAGAVADVTVAPSPEWMQARLRAAGVRPISNIVDVTNYVLLELGQPMHAFDLAHLAGAQIRVRTARAGERLRTLDGQDRELTPEMLVIADAERAAAIAGVMGGGQSEVTDTTKAIVFESAYFQPLSIRRTSKKLGLKTEASMRYERGADPRLPVMAMERACALLDAIGAGQARGTVVDRYPARVEPRSLRLRRARIAALLGVDVSDAETRAILESLGFALHDAEDGWNVTVPTRRVDVLREVDLIEDVARHYGFDRIPVTFPALTAAPAPVDPRIIRARQLRGLMTGAGFSEAVTFGFVAEKAAAPFAAEGELVHIANPLSENFGVLRSSAIPGLLDSVAHNRRREQRDVRLFEIGGRFSRSAGERRALACAWTGAIGADHWSGGTRNVDFFDVKGLVERIGRGLGLDFRTEPHREPWLVPGRSAAILVADARLGVCGLLSSGVAEYHGIPAGDEVFVVEIDLDMADALSAGDDVRIVPLPRFPSITRDISILVNDALAAAAVRQTVRAAGPPTLSSVREFDRYQGKGVPEGKMSLSLRLTFRDPERTLTDAEVQQAMQTVLAALRDQHDAVQR